MIRWIKDKIRQFKIKSHCKRLDKYMKKFDNNADIK